MSEQQMQELSRWTRWEPTKWFLVDIGSGENAGRISIEAEVWGESETDLHEELPHTSLELERLMTADQFGRDLPYVLTRQELEASPEGAQALLDWHTADASRRLEWVIAEEEAALRADVKRQASMRSFVEARRAAGTFSSRLSKTERQVFHMMERGEISFEEAVQIPEGRMALPRGVPEEAERL